MAKLEQQMLHDFAMDKIFTPENAKTATEQADKMLAEPSPFAKGEKVRLAHSLKRPEENDDHEIIGFYSNGEIIDENKASPYSRTYGVRVRNLKTGKEYPVVANDLKRIENKAADPLLKRYPDHFDPEEKEILKSGVADYLRAKGYDERDIIDKYNEISDIMASEGSDYYAEPDNILARLKEFERTGK